MQKTLNLRLGSTAYEALQALSKSRGVSMNKVVEEEILAAAALERKARLKAAFARVAAEGHADQNVDFAWDAQREVVLGEE